MFINILLKCLTNGIINLEGIKIPAEKRKARRGEEDIYTISYQYKDRVDMLIDALDEVFEEKELKEYVEITNSPLFKKVIGFLDKCEK